MRQIAEAFPPGVFIQEEMDARGWSEEDVARRMGDQRAYGMNMLCLGFILHVHDRNLILDRETAEGLSLAFGVSAELFLNLDAAWRAAPSPDAHATDGKGE